MSPESPQSDRIGTVHLVGAGPGDPDLLTLRAARLVMNASLIVHDGLVDARILEMARPGARLVSVAKSSMKIPSPAPSSFSSTGAAQR